jgi:hypothetical protein
MKGKRLTLATVISFVMLTLCGLESCSKNNSTSVQSDGTMTATINGAAYSAKSYVIGGYLISFGLFVVQGDSITNNKDTTEIQIAMPYDFPADQTIPIDTIAYADSLGITCRTSGKTYEAYYSFFQSHGYVTLASKDTVNHQLAGTFDGVLYNKDNSNDSLVIANGVFKSVYQTQ